MIICIPLVAEAPGVSSIIWREIIVVGVTESVEWEFPSARTTTDCVAFGSGNGMCSTGLVPDAIVIDCVTVAKPGAETARR